ncbi:hypothetical protein BDN71DRAFT_1484993 [Pleurotus eryngii]|uniref:CxC6 like cysteine cluster associated with KDZ domain-containing protein n=1 Tax=Pleurotus eryngii TaxID=5323 RepID=A0A9P5ZJJ5_PLEER|nr:hypothetical protein BDN71DRAFT_1484993 [Pleurotus eryngii]
MEVDNNPAAVVQPTGPVALGNHAEVCMVVIDGIVMGPRHCAMEGCEAGLQNAQTGVFCKKHVEKMKKKCHMKGCGKAKRMLRRAQEERQEWLPAGGEVEAVEHDNLEEQEVEENYFFAPRSYCMETICAPCGVVLAWCKFAKAEGVAKILKFLEDVYPDSASCPSYIAIDKGCALLKHIVRQGHWIAWEPTTCIIVDSYHCINHRATDHLCWTWCNPAPLNGDAPNLVVVDEDKEGKPYYKRAFNTQLILNQMTVSNVDFTMHVLLFLHTQCVIAMQQGRQEEAGDESEDEEDENGWPFGPVVKSFMSGMVSHRYGQQEVQDDDD